MKPVLYKFPEISIKYFKESKSIYIFNANQWFICNKLERCLQNGFLMKKQKPIIKKELISEISCAHVNTSLHSWKISDNKYFTKI